MVSTDVSIKEVEISRLLSQMIELGREVVARKLVVGSGGNLSFRVPGTDSFFITGTGTKLNQLTDESFALVDFEGNVRENEIKPSSEYRVHVESYRNRPDAEVCIHLHPQASVLSASLNLDIQFLTIDHVYYLRKVVRVPWIRPGTQEIALATGAALLNCNVVILENHGCLVVAPTVSLGLTRILNLEEAAELTLRAHQIGITPTPVPQAYRDHLEANNL